MQCIRDDGSSVELALLSCSPRAHVESEEHSSDVLSEDCLEAVDFTAATHAKHVKNMFRFYDVDASSWVIYEVADNCAPNQKVAWLLNIFHVGCKSHLLSLEANYMVERTTDLA